MRHAAVVALALVVVGCASGESGAPTTSTTDDQLGDDVAVLLDALERAFEPDVPVELTSADFLAGRDPVLSAALRPAPR